MRISSGIPRFDQLIEGGFPENSSILITGTPGTGKTIMLEQYLADGMKRNEKCIFITFDVRPETVINSMERFGWKIKNREDFIFLDCFSWRVGTATGKERYAISGLEDINQLNMVFTDLIKDIDEEKKVRIAVDSLSTLLLYSQPELIPKFLKDFIAKSTANGRSVILTLEEGIHEQKMINMLNYLVDGIIEMRFREDRRILRITKMKNTKHDRKWREFEIGKSGIILLH